MKIPKKPLENLLVGAILFTSTPSFSQENISLIRPNNNAFNQEIINCNAYRGEGETPISTIDIDNSTQLAANVKAFPMGEDSNAQIFRYCLEQTLGNPITKVGNVENPNRYYVLVSKNPDCPITGISKNIIDSFTSMLPSNNKQPEIKTFVTKDNKNKDICIALVFYN